MSWKMTKRVLWSLAAALAVGGALGWATTPERPWVYAHLEPGSFIGEYPSRSACEEARAAYWSGRHRDGGGVEINMSTGFDDACTNRIEHRVE